MVCIYSRHFNGIHMFITCNCFAHCYANFNLPSMLLSFVLFYKHLYHESSIETWHFRYYRSILDTLQCHLCFCLANAREGIFRKLDDKIELRDWLRQDAEHKIHKLHTLLSYSSNVLNYDIRRCVLFLFILHQNFCNWQTQTNNCLAKCMYFVYMGIVQSPNHNNNHVLKVYLFIFYVYAFWTQIASICQHTVSTTCNPIGSHFTQMRRWREIYKKMIKNWCYYGRRHTHAQCQLCSF